MHGVGNLDRSSAIDPCGTAHPYFTRKLGRLTDARIDASQEIRISKGNSEAKKLGIRFEKQVSQSFSSLYHERWVPQFAFRFNGNQRAIVDGLLFSEDFKAATIVEIKLRHTGDAFYQVWDFYKPIVDRAFKGIIPLSCLEICRYYDPGVKLQKPVAFIDDAREAGSIRECFHPVMIIGRM